MLLKLKYEFAGYKVVGKISSHHDGEREVYEVVDADNQKVVLTVFNLKSKRYQVESIDSIDEVRFVKNHTSLKGVPKYLASGTNICRRKRLGWMVQEFIDGQTIDEVIAQKKKLPQRQILKIVNQVTKVLSSIENFTGGGGHFNVSSRNIMLCYKDTELKDVFLVGFSNIGIPMESWIADKRYLDPSIFIGPLNCQMDVYSMAMVVLNIMGGEDFVFENESEDVVSSTPCRMRILKNLESKCSPGMRLVMKKATNLILAQRFTSSQEFSEYFRKVAKKQIWTTDVEEPSAKCQVLKEESNSEKSKKRKVGSVKVSDVGKKAKKKKGGLDAVAGMDELKALFRRDFVRILQNPQIAQAYNIRPNNCTMLYGPQGCGKSFIAEMVAQESGLSYKVVHPSDLGSVYQHGSQIKIAETFKEAENNAPMILIFDEFDALVPSRDSDINEHQANEVNEFLIQLNNCADRGIYVIATTNRPTRLDPACLRTGRVDSKIYVSLPDFEARKTLFELELEERPVEKTIDFVKLAELTEGYTCSDISFITKEAARRCFEETIDESLLNPILITTERVVEVVKNTAPSVTKAQNEEFLVLKAEMENQQNKNMRRKVGFVNN